MSLVHVLSLNSGSSSLKVGLHRVLGAKVETLLAESVAAGEAQDAIQQIQTLLTAVGLPSPEVIGHRVVHGGPSVRHHSRIDEAVLLKLEAARPFAPLHTPRSLALIRHAQRAFPELPQVACLDTCFHLTMPELARVLPIDRTLQAQGIEKVGFHGLSCESIVQQLGAELPMRMVIAHLGHGASVTAVLNGRSVDTSMGLTPSGGVMMGTRSGDLDPGVLIYLLREKHFDVAALEELIDHRSGLLGVSGIASDLRALHRAAASSADARLAIAMFCSSVKKQIAAMVAVLGGLDLLVFTGGIGEHDAVVRAGICEGLGWSGIELDEARNQRSADPISSAASLARVRVMPSEEATQIARYSAQLLGSRD